MFLFLLLPEGLCSALCPGTVAVRQQTAVPRSHEGAACGKGALAAPAVGEQLASVALTSAAGRFPGPAACCRHRGRWASRAAAFGQAPGGVVVLPHTKQLSGAAALPQLFCGVGCSAGL